MDCPFALKYLIRPGQIGQGHCGLSRFVLQAADILFLKDRDGRYLLINESGAATFGRTAEEMCGRTDRELFGAEAGEREAHDRQVLASGEAARVEELVHLPGGARTFLVRRAPYRDESDAIVGVLALACDVTPRTHVQQDRDLIFALTPI